MVTVVGIGPGHPDYITPAAVKRIGAAEVVIGARRVLDAIDLTNKEVIEVTADISAAMVAIDENKEHNTVVVVSGDPGFYSMLKTIRNKLPEIALDAVPGVSSMQMLFARIGEEWQGVALASVHGRSLDELDNVIKRHKRSCILTDNVHSAPAIARYLADQGITGRVVAGANLSYDEERIVDTTLAELAKLEGFESSVLYIELDS